MTITRRLAYSALIYNAIIWGAAFPLIKPAFEFITPTQYLYFRFLVAGCFGLPIFIYYFLKKRPTLSYTLRLLAIELLGLPLPLILLYTGLDKTSALDASLIGATGPIFVVLGGIWYLGERQTNKEWQGLALSLFGSLILVIEPLLHSTNLDTPSSTTGNLYIVGYNLLYAVYAIIAKKFYRTSPQLYFGPLLYLITATIYAFMLSTQNQLPDFQLLTTNYQVLLPVLYMAIPGGILAFALYLWAQSKIEVSEANLFTYLNGVVAIPVAFFLLGEKPSWLTLLAIIIISYGVLRAELRYTRAKNNKA
ncbi:MAG: hypothetical protein ACD_40C00323G0003 [uncultured bacterium]|nr:MAG: hypothetical protein ACD_40C00323G0003 [uncultured bacterium]